MIKLLDTVEGYPHYCGVMCFMETRCHGYTSSQENVCTLYDYYPLPIDAVVVTEYYQVYCI